MKLHVEIRGDGPDLVLLHGWALHGGMWGPWLDELAGNARLHLVDLPGHGESPWPAGLRDLDGLARAVYPAVPRGAALLGWSLGGMIAIAFARRHPRRLRALVLIATTPKFVAGPDWEHGMRPEVFEDFTRGLTENYGATVQNFLTLQSRGDERALETLRMLRTRLAARGEPDPRALAAGLSVLREADLRDDVPRVDLPALLLAGEHDRLTPPEASRAIATALPSARFRLIERSGHAPFLSHPVEVLGEVRGFLGRHPGEAAA
jgi:pimeloyl-[acyl-carrier protein] methyl ester esterase